MIEAVIFDLDGVICTTDDYHYQAWKALADDLGIAFDREKNNRLRGISRMASLDIVLEDSKVVYSADEKQALAEKKNEIYRALLQNIDPSCILPGIRETIKALKGKGVKLGIGSSSKNTKLILTKLELMDEFDAIQDGCDILRSKPDPEVFLKAASKLGIPPGKCAVVEDSSAGILAAKAAGMLAVAFGGDACQCAEANLSIIHPCELLKLFAPGG